MHEDGVKVGRFGRLMWPGLVFVLLGGSVLMGTLTTWVAVSDPSHAVEPDYYRKALNWDEASDERFRSASLGWSATVEVSGGEDALGRRVVRVTIRDDEGEPVEGASVEADGFHHARITDLRSPEFEPMGGGVYEARERLSREGYWEFRLGVSARGERFVHDEVVFVYPPNGEGAG